MMRMMYHPNVCALRAYFYNQGEKVFKKMNREKGFVIYKTFVI
jgi:hypothetical protein